MAVVLGSKSLARPYPFDEKFERALVGLICMRPDFYARFGEEIQPASLVSATHRLAVKAAQAIAEDLGRGPSDARSVMQQVRRWISEGRHTFEEAVAVNDLFDTILDEGLIDEEDAAHGLIPVLRKRMERFAVDDLIKEVGKADSDMAPVIESLQRAASVGKVDRSLGISFGDSSFAAFDRLRKREKFPTGVFDLDMRMNGGTQRGNLAMVMGGSGAGKSMFLDSLTAYGLTHGMHVGYFTLELEEDLVFARTMANISGIPTNDIMARQECEDAAKAYIAALPVPLAPGHVRYGTPGATTVREIRAWVELCEKKVKRPMDLLVVDYADLIHVPKVDRTYDAMKLVYEQLRAIATDKKMWVWTASQSKGREVRPILDLEDVADSMHKVRIADVVITLNPRENNEIIYHVAKCRGDESRYCVGPVPYDFAHGRMSYSVPAALPEMTGTILDAY
jgi:replicative DNA helicase